MTENRRRRTDRAHQFPTFYLLRYRILHRIIGFKVLGPKLSSRQNQNIISRQIRIFEQLLSHHSDTVRCQHLKTLTLRDKIDRNLRPTQNINRNHGLAVFKPRSQNNCTAHIQTLRLLKL